MFVNFSIFCFCFSWLIIIVEVVNLYAFSWDNLNFQKPKRSQQNFGLIQVQRYRGNQIFYKSTHPLHFPFLLVLLTVVIINFFFWLPRPTHVLSSTNTQSLGVTSCSPNPLFFPFKQLNEQTRVLNDSFIFLVQLQYVDDGYFSLKRYDCGIGGRCGHDQLFCLLGICDDVIGKKKKSSQASELLAHRCPRSCAVHFDVDLFFFKKKGRRKINRTARYPVRLFAKPISSMKTHQNKSRLERKREVKSKNQSAKIKVKRVRR